MAAIAPLTTTTLKTSEVTAGSKIYAASEADRYTAIANWTANEVVDKAVNITEAQTISGVKTFSAKPVLSAGATLASDMDFAQNEATSLVIENRTSDPATPATGQIWFRTDV